MLSNESVHFYLMQNKNLLIALSVGKTVSLCITFFLSGHFIFIAFAIFFESFRLHRSGWSDGRPRCVFRL